MIVGRCDHFETVSSSNMSTTTQDRSLFVILVRSTRWSLFELDGPAVDIFRVVMVGSVKNHHRKLVTAGSLAID